MFKRIASLATVAGLFVTGTALADISGSVHDFTDDIGTFTDLCAVCHTPHSSDTTVSDAPLWDHDLTVNTYTPYTSTTMDATAPNAATGISRLCLSCHDGTVAVDSYGGNTGTTFIATTGVFANVGLGMIDSVDNSMASEHPISIVYADAGGATGGMQAAPTGNATLFSGSVECASCHDVHNQTGNLNLLVTTNAGSQLCLECHIK